MAHTPKKPIRKVVGTGIGSGLITLVLAVISTQTSWVIDPGLAALITAAIGTFTGYWTPSAPGEPHPGQTYKQPL